MLALKILYRGQKNFYYNNRKCSSMLGLKDIILRSEQYQNIHVFDKNQKFIDGHNTNTESSVFNVPYFPFNT